MSDSTDRLEEMLARRKRPSHLQTRESEAYLQLIKDLNVVLAQEWQTQPEVKIRRGISEAIADSLRIYI
jgi:hypothetical protein